jgi:hypothetical protein
MREISMQKLTTVCGGGSVGDAYDAAMNLPIGGGKHVRNLPLQGPFDIFGGLVTWDANVIQRGADESRAVWSAR